MAALTIGGRSFEGVHVPSAVEDGPRRGTAEQMRDRFDRCLLELAEVSEDLLALTGKRNRLAAQVDDPTQRQHAKWIEADRRLIDLNGEVRKLTERQTSIVNTMVKVWKTMPVSGREMLLRQGWPDVDGEGVRLHLAQCFAPQTMTDGAPGGNVPW